MIQLIDILTLERTLNKVNALSKKGTFEIASQIAAKCVTNNDITESKIFNCLIARERLGSTGIGEGIAIPHCRLQGLDRTLGILMRLIHPINFDAIDNKPVDIVLTLLVPEKSTDEHLQLLAMIANHFSNEEVQKKMRNAPDDKTLYDAAVYNEQ